MANSGVADEQQGSHLASLALSGWRAWSIPLVLAAILWIVSELNFLLFHTLAEFFAIFVALILSVVSWHTYRFSRNHFLMYLGCGYFWIAMLDLAHALTFKGVGIFEATSPNTSIQFWIVTRYLEAILILSGTIFLARKINRVVAIILMGMIAVAALMVVVKDVLPVSYIDGKGLTQFKVVSEYIIVFLLTAAIFVIWKRRYLIDSRIMMLIFSSIMFTIAAEMCFTLYISVYGFFIFLGHIFKIVSYWLIYYAVVRTTLTEPYQVMAKGSSTYDAVPDPIILVDKDGVVHKANKAALTIDRNNLSHVIDQHCHDLFHPQSIHKNQCVVCEHIQKNLSLSNYEIYHPQTCQWFEYTLSPVDVSGVRGGMVHVAIDVTDRKNAEESLVQQANYDSLTQLPNRGLATDRLSQAIKQSGRTGNHSAVMFIDLDNFKVINDTLGHAFGDKLLVSMANILLECVRDSDTVARWSGDEFLIIIPELGSLIEVEQIAEKLLNAISDPIYLDNKEFIVSVSIGITGYPDDGSSSEVLLSNADAAMYKAKDAGKNTYRFFTSDMNVQAAKRLEMEAHLRNAISRQELYLVYQPQIDIVNKRIAGVEALLRWESPVMGNIEPAEFIPLAEEMGQIEQIGRWVLESVCKDIPKIKDHFSDCIRVSLNISSREFQNNSFVDNFLNTIKSQDVDCKCITFEVTESILLSDAKETVSKLEKLKNNGVNLSLDDFGTGYSSLSYLKKFPFDEIKIDRSFIKDLANDDDDVSLCRAIIAMAKSLGLTVIAEGVSSSEQFSIIKNLGVDQVQGYYFNKPVVLDELTQYISDFKMD